MKRYCQLNLNYSDFIENSGSSKLRINTLQVYFWLKLLLIYLSWQYRPVTATKEDLKNLYKSRWNIELDIRHIKTTMGMDVLSCLSPDMAEKEIWIYLLAYNLIRLIMIESALLCDVIPHQLSFKHTIQLWLTYHQQTGAANIELIKKLLFLVGQPRVGNRTRRVEPRVIKRRPKAYSMMVKSRSILRQEIVQNWTWFSLSKRH